MTTVPNRYPADPDPTTGLSGAEAARGAGRLVLTVVAALLFALGWTVAVICAAVVWVGTAVKVGWRDGWKAAERGPAR